jgi:hypothetical protein
VLRKISNGTVLDADKIDDLNEIPYLEKVVHSRILRYLIPIYRLLVSLIIS